MFGFKGTPGAEDFVEFLESNRMMIVLSQGEKCFAMSELFVGGIWSEKNTLRVYLIIVCLIFESVLYYDGISPLTASKLGWHVIMIEKQKKKFHSETNFCLSLVLSQIRQILTHKPHKGANFVSIHHHLLNLLMAGKLVSA